MSGRPCAGSRESRPGPDPVGRCNAGVIAQAQQAQGVQRHRHGGARVGHDGEPQRRRAEQRRDEEGEFRDERDAHVLPNHRHGVRRLPAEEAKGLGIGGAGHDDHVGGLERGRVVIVGSNPHAHRIEGIARVMGGGGGAFERRAALHHHAARGKRRHGGHDGDRCGDDERARARHHEEHERTIEPARPLAVEERRCDRHDERRKRHGRRVDGGEAFDPAFDGR